MKLHGKIRHNEKVFYAYDLGFDAQGQGRNQVRGHNRISAIKLPKIVFLINYLSKLDKTYRKIKRNE